MEPSKTYETATKRWEGVGPYYAMFPIRFADAVINEYTSPGDTVLDPFAGRGTTIFSAASLARTGIGIEISPVGWVYGKTKLNQVPYIEVENRLLEILSVEDSFAYQARRLPKFFIKCFCAKVRRFLLAARSQLDWRNNCCDRVLMALLLVYLHGKNGQALSNQMRQTKAFSPKYALKWWEDRKMSPPKIDPKKFLLPRIQWRYEKGVFSKNNSEIFLDDSTIRLKSLANWLNRAEIKKPKLLLTSPPYYSVTNYHYDQWLRLWMLGFEENAYVSRGPFQGRFSNRIDYQNLLRDVFHYSRSVISDDAVVYVRTSKESFTYGATLDALSEVFPNMQMHQCVKPFLKPTQTYLFGDKSPKAGEIDIILKSPSKSIV